MVQKNVADQGLANQIQGFKILGSYDASEKKNKEHDCIFFLSRAKRSFSIFLIWTWQEIGLQKLVSSNWNLMFSVQPFFSFYLHAFLFMLRNYAFHAQ